MSETQTYKGIDLVKLVMAFFVVAIHSGLFTDVPGELAFVTIQVFARMGVPFFFIASGFFFSKGLKKRLGEGGAKGGKKGAATGPGSKAASGYAAAYVRKLGGLFAFWAALMLPFWTRNGIRAHGFGPEFALRLLQTVVFDPGVFWYLEALAVCALFSLPFLSRGWEKPLLALSALFYVFGMFGDSYYGLVKDLPFFGDAYRSYFSVFMHVRKGLPFGLLFFSAGALFARHEGKLAMREAPLLAALAVSLILRYIELKVVNGRSLAIDNSVSLFVIPPALILFLVAYNARPAMGDSASKDLRSMSSTIFFSHQFMLELIILFVEFSSRPVTASLRFLVASGLCVGLYFAVSRSGNAFLRRMINS